MLMTINTITTLESFVFLLEVTSHAELTMWGLKNKVAHCQSALLHLILSKLKYDFIFFFFLTHTQKMTKSIHITLLTFTPSFGVCFVARLYPIICLASCPTTLGLRERRKKREREKKEKKVKVSVENHFKAESVLYPQVHPAQGPPPPS